MMPRPSAARTWPLFAVLLGVVLLVAAPGLSAQARVSEAELKATLLFNFCHFIDWPDHAFSGEKAPFVIGILGKNSIGDVLPKLVRDEHVRGRPIELREVQRLEDASRAHLLLICNSERGRLDEILATLQGRPTLTVGESDERGFTGRGAMIGFVTERERVRFQINLAAARAANLTINSRLLRLARVVDTES